MSAGRDVVIRSTSVTTANATTTGSNINQVASVNGKDVVLLAGRDLQANAAVIAASGDATLSAGRDVRLGVIQEYFRQEIRWADDKGGSNWVSRLTGPNFVDRANGAHGTNEVGVNRAVVSGSKEVATQVSGNSVRIQAGQDVTSKGAQVVAEGALQVEVGRDVRIGTANVSASARDQGQRSSSGILSATTVRTDDASSTSREAGSIFSGDTILVRSGNDVNVKGSQIVSTQGTKLVAGGDVNIVAASESSTQHNFRQETKSGVMGAGIGVTVGSRMQSRDVDRNRETASASTIGSVQGDVGIVAGNRYTQVGSDVLAPGGDIDIVARTVSILAAQQGSRTVTEDKFRQQGVTVAVTSPVLSAVQTVQQMAEAASKTRNGRVQALAAATAGMSVYSAVGEMQKGAAEGSANVGISATIGGSQNSSRTEQNTVTQRGSTVVSGGDMSISAKGDGANSNIIIAGSDINAKGNLTLKADNDINLIATQNTDEQHSDRSSSSWGVGVTAQFGTKTQFGFTANAAGSRGNSDGKDVSNVTTRMRAGGQAKLESGRDTNLIGATVSGEQVVANVGRDLNIASVQDTSTFKSRDQSIGGSATIGPSSGGSISASRSRVDADYANVGQQAGITAGNGGLQINVKRNTDLKAAQIASTDQALEQGKNNLTTGTLTSSDLQNRSQYSAQSQSVSAGTSGGKPGGGIGIGNASGSETSVTRSGVSGGAVTITDAQAQQEKTGQSPDHAVASLDTCVRTGKDSSNGLAKNWDGNQLREDVEAQAKITRAFGQQASKLIGDYAEQQQKKAEDLRKQANAATDPAVATQLNDQASALETKWGPDGNMRALAHTVVGGLTGGLAGAAGAGAGTLAAPKVASALNQAGVDADLAKVLTGLSSTLVGAVAGGAPGGAAAYNEVVNNFLKHADAAALKKEIEACSKKNGRCSDGDVTSIFKKYKEISDQNIAAVQSCIISGDVACVQKNLAEAASVNEVKVLPFGYTKLEDTLIGRQANVISYGSVMGNASLMGTDVDQAKEVATFRTNNCGGLSAAACDGLVKQAMNYRLLRIAALSAIAAATPALVGEARKLVLPKEKLPTVTLDRDRYTADQDLENVYGDVGRIRKPDDSKLSVADGSGKNVAAPQAFVPAPRTGLKFEIKAQEKPDGRIEIELSARQKFDKAGVVVASDFAQSDLIATYYPKGILHIDWYGTTISGKGVGTEMISRSIEFVGPERIATISAKFGNVNRGVFWDALSSGRSVSDAAWATPLGKTMRSLGFKNVSVIGDSAEFSR
ncbi:hypothetical protein GWL_05200 [Herbaspirillum sp. GW103]|nr:hypothetical protein GWL_05200 [Herbaspirillum sp. GW103]